MKVITLATKRAEQAMEQDLDPADIRYLLSNIVKCYANLAKIYRQEGIQSLQDHCLKESYKAKKLSIDYR